jgi:hypothetical protein
MMKDEKVAKSFLSAIIEEEVLELDFSTKKCIDQPEVIKKEEDIEKRFQTVCRFDFIAKISRPDGGIKTVIIEVQKAKLPSDIMRFRQYRERYYQNTADTYDCIYCIFLLTYDVGFPDHSVIQLDANSRRVQDVTTKEYLYAGDNEFVQSLHHRSWIVQIDQLKHRRRNDIEKLLSIFDQDNLAKGRYIMNDYIIKVDEDDFPETYSYIINRLRMAHEDEQMNMEMEGEVDYLSVIQDGERFIAVKDKIIESYNVIEEQSKIAKTLEKQLGYDKATINN